MAVNAAGISMKVMVFTRGDLKACQRVRGVFFRKKIFINPKEIFNTL